MTTENVTEAVSKVVSESVAPINPLIVEPKVQSGVAQLWQPWTLIVPALLVLPMLGMAVSWQISPTTDEVLRQQPHHRVQAEATMPPRTSSQVNIFVPGDDQTLHRRSIGNPLHFKSGEAPTALETELRLEGVAALKKLFAAAPDYFPPGTAVEELSLEQTESGLSIAHVSLNDTFWNSDYWQMDSRAPLTIQAIAHTLSDVYQGSADNFHVLLLRGNQNPGHLGQDDIADPIPLDANLIGEPAPAATAIPAPPAPPSVTWPAPSNATPVPTVAAP